MVTYGFIPAVYRAVVQQIVRHLHGQNAKHVVVKQIVGQLHDQKYKRVYVQQIVGQVHGQNLKRAVVQQIKKICLKIAPKASLRSIRFIT